MPLPDPAFYAARHARLAAVLDAVGLQALLVTSLTNITYLSGLVATSAMAVFAHGRLWLMTDSRYRAALHDRARAIEGLVPREVCVGGSYEDMLVEVLAEADVRRVGFEGEHLAARRLRWLESRLQGRGELVETFEVVERLRAVKDAWEQAVLREAGARLSDAAKCILSRQLEGLLERDVARLVAGELERAGFSKPAFDTIVASGPNGAMPHHRAGDRRLVAGDLVLLDFGGVWEGYVADISRTVVLGRPTARQRAWIEAVVAAQDAAIGVMRPGTRPEEVDAAARGVLNRAGLDTWFLHGTGHGLGLQVHELPRLAPRRGTEAGSPLEAGMVATVEPGVYVEGEGGVRIEDDVLITGGGVERLTDAPRALL